MNLYNTGILYMRTHISSVLLVFVSFGCRNYFFQTVFLDGPMELPAMAATAMNVWKGCQRHFLHARDFSPLVQRIPPFRTFAAVKTKKKSTEESEKETIKEKKFTSDRERHKPFGKTAWVPVDDVYISRFYPRTRYHVADGIKLLKTFQGLDFTPHNQPVFIDLKLNMKLEKKKKVDPFVSTVHLPHPFKTEMNTVLVFTEDDHQAKVAQENGAVVVGGVELIQPILDNQIAADFYVAVPDIVSKLVPLKNKLRKNFPKTKRGSVSTNIPKMLELFKRGHKYNVEDGCYIRTQIAKLNMSNEQICDNLQTVLVDVRSHRPAHMGPFIERAIISSQTSEAIWFQDQDVLPHLAKQAEEQ